MTYTRRLQAAELYLTPAERGQLRLSRGDDVQSLTNEELKALTDLPESQWLKSVPGDLLNGMATHFDQLPPELLLSLPAAYTVGLETFENALTSLRRAIRAIEEKQANV